MKHPVHWHGRPRGVPTDLEKFRTEQGSWSRRLLPMIIEPGKITSHNVPIILMSTCLRSTTALRDRPVLSLSL